MSDPEHDSEPAWFERRENQDRLFYALLVVAGILTLLGLLHPHFPGAGVFGFIIFAAIAFAGLMLRTLIMRDEDYYDRR